jgi:uncharacterized protein (TIGR03435 family)
MKKLCDVFGSRRRLLLSMAGLLALAVPVVFGPANATPTRTQSQPDQAAKLAFDVASIKPAAAGGRGGRGGSIHSDPDMLSARSVSLQRLVREAYQLWNYQLSGGPSWIDSDAYDVIAKTDQPVSDEQRRLMLQALLADRFKLTFHRETKELPIFALMVDKNGPKFRPLKEGEQPTPSPLSFKDLPSLAGMLSNVAGRPVLDRTGLSGNFDLAINMRKAEEEWQREHADVPPTDPGDNMIVFAAKEQLGLKLVPTKGPVEMYVVDHAEKPSGN